MKAKIGVQLCFGVVFAFALAAQAETYFDGQYVWNYKRTGDGFVESRRPF